MFDIVRDSESLTVTIAADPANIDQACLEARKMLHEHGLEKESFAVLLGMREALSNAINHGCNSDPEKQVVFFLGISEGELTIRVEDSGPGFNWAAYSFDPPGTESQHGRGLSIMKNYFQQVSYNETGNQVVMKKAYTKGARMSEILIEGDSAVVVPQHDIVSTMVNEFRQELKELIDKGVNDVTLDLSAVEMMDSIGMGLLIAAYNSLRKRQGKLKLVNVTNDILGLLRTMRLDKHFEISA